MTCNEVIVLIWQNMNDGRALFCWTNMLGAEIQAAGGLTLMKMNGDGDIFHRCPRV